MKTIGIIGGGQLGLMIAEQARELGVRTVCLDPMLPPHVWPTGISWRPTTTGRRSKSCAAAATR